MPPGSSAGAPCTWVRKPSSAYLSAVTMPDLASRKEASTSWVLFPIEETIPIPVMTTRLMLQNSCLTSRPWSTGPLFKVERRPAEGSRRGWSCGLDQAHPQILGLIYARSIGFEPDVGDAEHQFGFEHAFQFHAVDNPPDGGQDLIGKFDLAHAERPAASIEAKPAEIKTKELPKRIEPEAARHHRIALEMAAEKPEVWLDRKFGQDHALAIGAALFRNIRDSIEHQKRRQRESRIAWPKEFAPRAGDQVLIFEIGTPLVHVRFTLAPPPGRHAGLLRRSSRDLLTHGPPSRKPPPRHPLSTPPRSVLHNLNSWTTPLESVISSAQYLCEK